ncbi:MAG: quinolinate synthase NadA [Moorea sp. SIO3C2]|nr:quinolinate synthase NadA [Moorena sp. SIO3C2]
MKYDLFGAIEELKKELNAVILVHYYQEPDLQDIADYLGDYLTLSPQAATTDVAYLILKSAAWRTESRGGHYRSDYPQTSDRVAWPKAFDWLFHTLIQGDCWHKSGKITS